MKNKRHYIFYLIFLFSLKSFSQKDSITNSYKKWFASIDVGVQMSGIKSEDFVSSNYSPLVRLSLGKWINKSLGVQVGYQGKYFNTIENSDKRFYNFYFVEGVLNAKNILQFDKKDDRFYELLFHLGFGYFKNKYYKNSSFHYILGANNNFKISKKLKIKLDIGAIIGWDIYQGNDDILPSLSLGLIYRPNKI